MKTFLKEFFICVLLSALADAFIVAILRLDPNSNLFGDFMLFLYYWIVGGEGGNFIIGILLFTLYYFVVFYLVMNTKGQKFYLLMILWAVVFIATVTIDEWNLVEERITFGEHFRKGAHYGVYSVVVAAVETIFGLIKKQKRMATIKEIKGPNNKPNLI